MDTGSRTPPEVSVSQAPTVSSPYALASFDNRSWCLIKIVPEDVDKSKGPWRAWYMSPFASGRTLVMEKDKATEVEAEAVKAHIEALIKQEEERRGMGKPGGPVKKSVTTAATAANMKRAQAVSSDPVSVFKSGIAQSTEKLLKPPKRAVSPSPFPLPSTLSTRSPRRKPTKSPSSSPRNKHGSQSSPKAENALPPAMALKLPTVPEVIPWPQQTDDTMTAQFPNDIAVFVMHEEEVTSPRHAHQPTTVHVSSLSGSVAGASIAQAQRPLTQLEDVEWHQLHQNPYALPASMKPTTAAIPNDQAMVSISNMQFSETMQGASMSDNSMLLSVSQRNNSTTKPNPLIVVEDHHLLLMGVPVVEEWVNLRMLGGKNPSQMRRMSSVRGSGPSGRQRRSSMLRSKDAGQAGLAGMLRRSVLSGGNLSKGPQQQRGPTTSQTDLKANAAKQPHPPSDGITNTDYRTPAQRLAVFMDERILSLIVPAVIATLRMKATGGDVVIPPNPTHIDVPRPGTIVIPRFHHRHHDPETFQEQIDRVIESPPTTPTSTTVEGTAEQAKVMKELHISFLQRDVHERMMLSLADNVGTAWDMLEVFRLEMLSSDALLPPDENQATMKLVQTTDRSNSMQSDTMYGSLRSGTGAQQQAPWPPAGGNDSTSVGDFSNMESQYGSGAFIPPALGGTTEFKSMAPHGQQKYHSGVSRSTSMESFQHNNTAGTGGSADQKYPTGVGAECFATLLDGITFRVANLAENATMNLGKVALINLSLGDDVICGLLKHVHRLHTLDLRENRLTDATCNALADVLGNRNGTMRDRGTPPRTHTILLSGNRISNEGAWTLSDLLTYDVHRPHEVLLCEDPAHGVLVNVTSLQLLDVSRNCIDTHCRDHVLLPLRVPPRPPHWTTSNHHRCERIVRQQVVSLLLCFHRLVPPEVSNTTTTTSTSTDTVFKSTRVTAKPNPWQHQHNAGSDLVVRIAEYLSVFARPMPLQVLV